MHSMGFKSPPMRGRSLSFSLGRGNFHVGVELFRRRDLSLFLVLDCTSVLIAHCVG